MRGSTPLAGLGCWDEPGVGADSFVMRCGVPPPCPESAGSGVHEVLNGLRLFDALRLQERSVGAEDVLQLAHSRRPVCTARPVKETALLALLVVVLRLGVSASPTARACQLRPRLRRRSLRPRRLRPSSVRDLRPDGFRLWSYSACRPGVSLRSTSLDVSSRSDPTDSAPMSATAALMSILLCRRAWSGQAWRAILVVESFDFRGQAGRGFVVAGARASRQASDSMSRASTVSDIDRSAVRRKGGARSPVLPHLRVVFLAAGARVKVVFTAPRRDRLPVDGRIAALALHRSRSCAARRASLSLRTRTAPHGQNRGCSGMDSNWNPRGQWNT